MIKIERIALICYDILHSDYANCPVSCLVLDGIPGHMLLSLSYLFSLQPRRVPWPFAFHDFDTFGKKQASYLVGRLLFGAFLVITLGDAFLAGIAQK